MANFNKGIELDGLDEFIKEMGAKREHVEKIVIEEMSKFGLLAEEGARALAPKDVGDLEININFDQATSDGNTVTVIGGSDSEYALRRHEEPYSTGTYGKYDHGRFIPDYYVDGRGKKTRNKSTWRGYEPGRKYLENAVKAIEGKDFDILMDRVMTRIFEET